MRGRPLKQRPLVAPSSYLVRCEHHRVRWVDNPAGLDTQAQKEITARGIQAETLPNFGAGRSGWFVRLASAARELEANNAAPGAGVLSSGAAWF